MKIVSLLVCAWCLALSAAPVSAHRYVPARPSQDPAETSEENLIQYIRNFRRILEYQDKKARRVGARAILSEELITHADALIVRFPNSSFKDEAIVAKLGALAELARTKSPYLGELLALTGEIARQNPAGQLASENEFYAIQAFVLAARREKMPEPKRLQGTAERYVAFLEGYPNSDRVPVIRASLIRNLISLDQVDRARSEFTELERDHSTHHATARARGELSRVDALGKPFAFERTTAEGKTIRTKDYLGQVLVVHFWATWSAASLDEIPGLIKLNRRYKADGLQLIGINVDTDRQRVGKALEMFDMSWPQFFDEKGFESDTLVEKGVVSIPTYFVVDRKGTLRGTSGGKELTRLVRQLLAEPGEDR